MLFRQLFDTQSSTYSYLLADEGTREAVIIDSVYEQFRRDEALLLELDLKLKYSLETHVHADHVTGAWLLREHLGSQIVTSAKGGAKCADRYVEHNERLEFGGRYLSVLETPGHTLGCVTYVLDTQTMAFTGDCLLIRGCGRTDFQGGDADTLFHSVHSHIFTLPDDCLLYPAHDYRGLTVTSVREEKAFNPRLGGQLSASDFAGLMNNLGLAHPRQIDVAVPANAQCGRPMVQVAAADEPTWAPLNYTFAGIWEVQPQWLEENLRAVQIVDVREPDEFCGPLGHIPNALSIPLSKLAESVAQLSTERPVVAVCRAGGRSAQATTILRREGISDCANLAGGMLRWRALHCPVEGGLD